MGFVQALVKRTIMKSNLIQILAVILVSCALTSLGQEYENEEMEETLADAPIKRYLRSRPLRWGKRGGSSPLRWGKRWGTLANGARYGKRQQTSSPLRWGKRSGDKRQEPLRWGKRLANVWAPSWTPEKDNTLERMIDLHESTTPIEDFGFQESTTPTYSWGTKFPIRTIQNRDYTTPLVETIIDYYSKMRAKNQNCNPMRFGKRSSINEEYDYDLYPDSESEFEEEENQV